MAMSNLRIPTRISSSSAVVARAHYQKLIGELILAVASPVLIPRDKAPEHPDFGRMRTLQNSSRPNLWLTWLRLAGQKHSGAIIGPRFDNSKALISAAIHGLGIALVPALYVEGEILTGQLWCPFGPPVATEESFWIVQPERRNQKPSASLFKLWLKRSIRRT